jgi:ATP-binding cassette subfamily B protein
MRDMVFCLGFLLRLSWQTSRGRLLVGGSLLLLGFLASPLISVELREIVNSVLAGHRTAVVVWSVATAVALVAELMLGHFAHLSYFELGEQNEETLGRELLRIVNGSGGLQQCDDPAFADDVDLLRQDIVKMRSTVESVLQLACLIIQTLVTSAILASVQPWLLLLPPVAVAPVLLGRRGERQLDEARVKSAPAVRAIRHLRDISSSPESQKEIRLSGSFEYLIGLEEKLQRDLSAILGPAERRYALLRAGGQGVFALAYVASIIFVFRAATHGEASIGDAVMVITLATQISRQMASGFELFSAASAASLGLRRLVGLRERSGLATADVRMTCSTDVMRSGITFDKVTFAYPGAQAAVLRDVDLHLPAGRSVALVGSNGAGKSTLIKLLNGLYDPSSGRVLVDGVDLADLSSESWRSRSASLFQDFAQLHFVLRESVGVGQIADVESGEAVLRAIGRARAGSLLERMDNGVETLLGKGYDDGTDLSGGQWQSIGLARTMMRSAPLLLCLDEPGHALDALAEQLMCDAYEETAREVAATVGGVTIFVTHRMSTVRLADMIVVLDAGSVIEAGSHNELMARGGHYAELFELQSRGYARSAL